MEIMKHRNNIKAYQNRLNKRYKELIEQAYNFKQTDSALSDISEYRAIKLLNEINRIKYLTREPSQVI